MKNLLYTIQFFSYWHASSGLAGGSDVNLTVIKDKHGLPYLPGKTLRGLLRDAALSLYELGDEAVSTEFLKRVFGWNDATYPRAGGVYSCYFTSAYLGDALRHQMVATKSDPEETATEKAELRRLLYDRLASTAIDEHGQARDNTLRQIEASIPLILYAQIEDFPDEEPAYLHAMQRCMSWVKHLGLNRSRGLGRCQFLPDW